MKIAFDPAKDASNRLKHGVSLDIGGQIIADAVTTVQDGRFDYGEDRFAAYGYIGERLYVCVFAVRDETNRIISVRKAHKQEVARHG